MDSGTEENPAKRQKGGDGTFLGPFYATTTRVVIIFSVIGKETYFVNSIYSYRDTIKFPKIKPLWNDPVTRSMSLIIYSVNFFLMLKKDGPCITTLLVPFFEISL